MTLCVFSWCGLETDTRCTGERRLCRFAVRLRRGRRPSWAQVSQGVRFARQFKDGFKQASADENRARVDLRKQGCDGRNQTGPFGLQQHAQ